MRLVIGKLFEGCQCLLIMFWRFHMGIDLDRRGRGSLRLFKVFLPNLPVEIVVGQEPGKLLNSFRKQILYRLADIAVEDLA